MAVPHRPGPLPEGEPPDGGPANSAGVRPPLASTGPLLAPFLDRDFAQWGGHWASLAKPPGSGAAGRTGRRSHVHGLEREQATKAAHRSVARGHNSSQPERDPLAPFGRGAVWVRRRRNSLARTFSAASRLFRSIRASRRSRSTRAAS